MPHEITLTFSFPTQERADAAIHVLSVHYGYPDFVPGEVPELDEQTGEPTGNMISGSVPNPETRLAFVKKKHGEELKAIVRAQMRQQKIVELDEQLSAQFEQTTVS